MNELTRLYGALDRLLAHCPDAECSECAKAICPHGEPLHFHHDGCPVCSLEEDSKSKWTLKEAIDLCELVERVCPEFGYHVGLSLLYKEGARKDADLLFYQVRRGIADKEKLFEALEKIGLKRKSDFGFVQKAEYNGKPVNCLFPDEPDLGEHESPEEA